MEAFVDNRRVHFFDPPIVFVRDFDRRTAYKVEGAQFNQAYRMGRWDGKEHLIKKHRGVAGHYSAPVGLLADLIALSAEWELELKVDDRRRRPASHMKDLTWNPEWQLREYQMKAIDEACEERDWYTGKGLLRLPTRSGKTVIAAGIIHRLKVRTLFLVQSEMLLSQTHKLFTKVFGEEPGLIGKGRWDPRRITVASVQTLTRRLDKPEAQKLLGEVDLMFFDECHHLEGTKWREVLENSDAFYKFGLSATIYLPEEGETNRGTIWLRGATGNILFEMEPSDLIRMGFLLRPDIRLRIVEGPAIEAFDYHEAYEQGIVQHEARNDLIAAEALQAHQDGLSVLVVSKRIDHVNHLLFKMSQLGLKVADLVGNTPSDKRRRLVEDFNARKLHVLIGTVFGEGVDIPSIECVINAEAGKSQKATIQRFRNLTPADGKTKARFIDFMDFHSKWLAEHSRARLKAYRKHEMFQIRVIE